MAKTSAQLRAQKKYKASPKGRATDKRYGASPKGRASTKKYQTSPRGIQKRRERHRKVYDEHMRILSYMVGDVCPVCGGIMAPPHFHHPDPSTKLYSISHMDGMKVKLLYEELDKCEVMCASCHSKISIMETRPWEILRMR